MDRMDTTLFFFEGVAFAKCMFPVAVAINRIDGHIEGVGGALANRGSCISWYKCTYVD